MASSEPTPRKRLAGVRGLERLRLRYAQKRDLRSIWCLFDHRGRGVTEWSIIVIGGKLVCSRAEHTGRGICEDRRSQSPGSLPSRS